MLITTFLTEQTLNKCVQIYKFWHKNGFKLPHKFCDWLPLLETKVQRISNGLDGIRLVIYKGTSHLCLKLLQTLNKVKKSLHTYRLKSSDYLILAVSIFKH